MDHYLPPHGDPGLAQHTLQSALTMDPNHPQQQPPPQHLQGQQPPLVNAPRKRKKMDPESGEPATPAEPRRLRRSHEACARCRSKKIKCDSKHPRCTACASAGVQCHQEDRHRQTLVARGHTEHVERQLDLCVALLKRHIPDFDLNDIEGFAARAGVEVDPLDPNAPGYPFPQNGAPGPNGRGYPLRSEGPQPGEGSPPRGYPYGLHPPPPHMIPPPPPGYPNGMSMYGGPHPYPPHMSMQGPPPQFAPHMPQFAGPIQPPAVPPRPLSAQDTRGAEPLPNDLSTSRALAKNFGVSAAIVGDLTLAPAAIDTEDLAVGSSGLTSRRDRDITAPRDAAKWITVTTRPPQSSPTVAVPPALGSSQTDSDILWLPKDRDMLRRVLDAFFNRLNYHRPLFVRSSFDKALDALYSNTAFHDPGFVCSLYLMLALGTLSELNHRVTAAEKDGKNAVSGPPLLKKFLPADWPTSEDFFERALAVKPDLRVTVSSLQALILLHWYLYTERQGRSLWRLVGSMVRLAIELGLHHDPHVVPSSEDNPDTIVFTDEECQLRIRLWAVVLLHDRGTSILLGRPLAIAPLDSNTPRPNRGKPNELSEHFYLSAPIAEIQADIINSLYAPTRQSADSIMRHAVRILKSMVEFRRQLPDSYKWYFNGTDEWPTEKRKQLVQDISEDQGLTLLKIGIARILLLRALFSSKELPFHSRLRALVDAIVTSHNIIVVHHQLIRFPDIAFFVSPIPLHIAAMVILYGHMSKCERLAREVALEDVWMALDMLPSFRWRWERKEVKGGHPLIAKLAEEVLKVNLHQVSPVTPPMLISEADWDTEGIYSPKALGQHPTTPTIGHAQYTQNAYTKSPPVGPAVKGSPGKPGMASLQPNVARDEKLAEVPPGLFFPFFQEALPPNTTSPTALLNAVPSVSHGFQSNQEPYMLEEKDVAATPGMHVWQPNGRPDARPMAPFNLP